MRAVTIRPPSGAFSAVISPPCISTMALAMGDSQAQARAARLPGARLVHAIKALKDALQLLLGHAAARILHAQANVLPVLLG